MHLVTLSCDATGSAAARVETNGMLAAALSYVESMGDVPALICGDLNQLMEELPVSAALQLAGWQDVGDGPTSRG